MQRREQYINYIKRLADELKKDLLERESTFLISGITGLIGTVLTDTILRLNDIGAATYRVIGLCRNQDRAEKIFTEYMTRADFQIIACDVNKTIPNVGTVDYVIHAASNTHPLDYSSDPIGTISSNVIGTNNLLQFARENGCRRFVFLSSVEIYGENRGDTEKFVEEYCGYINCNTVRAGYPESKRTGEALCQAYGKECGLNFVIPRLCRIYGPTMSLQDSKAIAQFIKKAARREDIVLKSSGKQLFSYLDVFQAVSGIWYIMMRGESGEVYNVSSDMACWHMEEVANMLADIAGTQVIFEPPEECESAGFSTATKALLDNTRLRNLGWKEIFDCKEILKFTVEEIRERIGETYNDTANGAAVKKITDG